MELIRDMSDPKQRREVLNLLNPLQGLHRIEVVKYRPRRTDRQNRYYWPCFVHPFGEYLREQGNTHFTDDMAHEVLKRMFLTVTEIDKTTGRAMDRTRSTTELTTAEFNEYLEKVAAFLATDCGFAVAEPSEYRVEEEVAA